MVTTRRHLPPSRPTRAARHGGLLLLAVLGGLAQAAELAASAPLDLSLPREAGQWTGIASRVRSDAQRGEGFTGTAAPQALGAADPRGRTQPYGTGYEARMSALRADGGATSPTGAGPARAGGAPPPVARGGGRGR